MSDKCKRCGVKLEGGAELTIGKCLKCWHIEGVWSDKNSSYRQDEIICPYCDESQDEYWACNEGDHEEVECQCCGRKFDLTVETLYSTKRSLCEMPEGWTAESEEDE